MRRSSVALGLALVSTAAAVVVTAGCGGTKTATETTTVTVSDATETGLGPPRVRTVFGFIDALNQQGDGFELRFDPAWFLSGETANGAAAEDGVVAPGEPVPNDHYVVEEGHRLLTYRVPGDAHVTVVTNRGDPPRLGSTPITVAELARIVAGTSGFELFEPLRTGVWITVDVDTVQAIHQQYRP